MEAVTSAMTSSRRAWLAAGAVLLLAVAAQVFVSAASVLAVLISLVCVVLAFRRPLSILGLLALYLPFEPFLLTLVPNDLYIFVRYLSEGLIYLLCAVVLWRLLIGQQKLKSSPIDLPFALFLTVLLAAALINAVPPSAAILGARQILRFLLVFFLVLNLRPSATYIKQLTIGLFSVLAFEAVLGYLQVLSGGALDAILLPAASKTLGDITLTSGVVQYWDPGSRAFATFGRYDLFGNFLAFFLPIIVAYFYEMKLRPPRPLYWLIPFLGLPVLIFTYSRASWFAFLIAFLVISVGLFRDRRVVLAFAAFAIVALGYIGLTGLNVRFITEVPGQTLVERFYESFSITRWRGEYYGLGRVFWMVQVPNVVVPSAPLFGVGPGQFGGGAAAALGQTRVYDRLGLPFGVFGTDGYIDNNWFALWAETGTLGLLAYLWMYIILFRSGLRLGREGQSPWVRALGKGYAAALCGAVLIAFLSTALEIRTFGFYLWLYGGFVMVLLELKTHTEPVEVSTT